MSEWRDTDIKHLLNKLERIAKALEKKNKTDTEYKACTNCKHFSIEADDCKVLGFLLNGNYNPCRLWERIDK